VRAAIAVSMHALDDVDPGRVEKRLRILSLRVRERSPSGRPAALLANLHAVLFEEEGFGGNLERYYNALNSYLPAVLDTRRGVPITLGLIYMAVGRWAGLEVLGINAPGHFLVRVRCDNAWIIVDPFFAGQMLSRSEAFDRLECIVRQRLPRTDELLATPTHAQWLTRILGNLRQLFASEGRRDDLAAMTELATALESTAR
jgi:regulator of sirC expression with transglutaminase-like and TPR domain